MKITYVYSGRHVRAVPFCATLAVVGVAMLLLGAPVSANAPITSYSTLPSTTQAGGHPDIEINFSVKNRILQASHNPCDCEDAKDSTVELPAGFVGNPHATPQCSAAEFALNSCPIDSQIGIVSVGVTSSTGGAANFDSAVYNLVPPPEVSGLTGFKIFTTNVPQFLQLSARTGGDYGLNATAISLYHGASPLNTYRQELWGVPADRSHNLLRLDTSELGYAEPAYLGNLCDANGVHSTTDPSTIVEPCETNFKVLAPHSSNSPLTPFLQNPTTCSAPLSSALDVLAYDGQTTYAESPWPQMTGCDQLSFNPSLSARPTTTSTDTPSGIDVNLSIPQQVSALVPSPTELRATTVTLPPGFSINPNAADGKTSCTEAEARFGSEEEGQCPDFSKVGSLTIESSALPGPLPGYVYIGQPLPGERYRIFLVAGGFAFHVKLAGTVTPNPATGQLAITFQNLPQNPLTAFNMHFFGSERGLLATPTQCGTYPVTTTFTPWDETIGTQTSTQFFTLNSGPNGTPCPAPQRPFQPGFEAASSANAAAAHTPFSLEVTRNDGDQNLSALNVTTPPGFLATLKGVAYCPQASIEAAEVETYSGADELANPSCPEASQVGETIAGAGAGDHPIYLSGKVYLAGPYRGAPLSLAVITPAISGPYDLGNVVVRAALNVNPETAQVSAASSSLPQIFGGIPFRLRSIRLSFNRPNFTLNPTNCDPFSVASEIFGNQGAVAHPSERYQVANCAALSFAPKLTTRITGSTNHTGNPALHTELSFPQSGPSANVSRISVTLPHSFQLDQGHIKTVCTRVQFTANQCPAGSLLGFAKAETPLLEKPLEGPVYLRTSGNKLPDIVAQLKGQIEIDLDGSVDSVNGQLRTTFETVPDAPVSKFALDLDGGTKSLLVNSINLCSATQHVNVQLDGQNGKTANQNPVLETPCGTSHKHKVRPAYRAHPNRRGHR